MNMKKLLALLTALMMLCASTAAFADSPHEMVEEAYEDGRLVTSNITATLGTVPLDESTVAMLTDLLDILRIEISYQEGSDAAFGQGTVYLGEQSALTFSGIMPEKASNFFVSTSLLGDQLLYFTPDDLAGLYLRLIDMQLSADSSFSQESKNEILDMLQDSTQQSAIQFSANSLDDDDLEDAYEDFVDQFLSSPKMAAIEQSLTKSAVTTQGIFEGEDHDTAVTQSLITISKEDMTSILQAFLETVQQNEFAMQIWESSFSSTFNVGEEALTPEETIAKLIAEVPQYMEVSSYDNIPVTFLLDKSGELVAMNILFESVDPAQSAIECRLTNKTNLDGSSLYGVQFTQTDDSNGSGALITINYLDDSKTQDQIAFNMTVFNKGLATNEIALSYVCEKDYSKSASTDHAVLTFTMAAEGVNEGIVANISNQATYDGTDVNKTTIIDLYNAGATEPLVTIKEVTTSVAADDVALPQVADAVRLGAMTEDELTQWAASAQIQLMTGLQTIMMALPSSVLNALMGQ